MLKAPLLVLAWGNRSRGDDALGPLALDALQAWAESEPAAALAGQIEFLEEHQLQVENALDLAERRAVLFIDASLRAVPPFAASEVQPRRDPSFTSHALSPEALLEACRMVGVTPPPATLLGIRGEAFELGCGLSLHAQVHLDAALHWARGWLLTQVGRVAPVQHAAVSA